MRISLLLAICVAFVLAPSASAQKTVKAWYQLSSGERVEMVQTDRVSLSYGKQETVARVGGREFMFSGPVSVEYRGTGAEPTSRADRGSSSDTAGSGGGSYIRVKTETVVGFDGSVTTKTTTHRTDSSTGEQTTTTTTTTTTADDETTSETTTDGDDE